MGETKHLGMILDHKLSFENHLEEKMAKANQGIGLMKQLKKWVSYNTVETIYKLYVRAHLDYEDMVYDISELNKSEIFNSEISNSLSKKIESIQYEAEKIVTGA